MENPIESIFRIKIACDAHALYYRQSHGSNVVDNIENTEYNTQHTAHTKTNSWKQQQQQQNGKNKTTQKKLYAEEIKRIQKERNSMNKLLWIGERF